MLCIALSPVFQPWLSNEGETNNSTSKWIRFFFITFGVSESLPGGIEGETEKFGVVSPKSVSGIPYSLSCTPSYTDCTVSSLLDRSSSPPGTPCDLQWRPRLTPGTSPGPRFLARPPARLPAPVSRTPGGRSAAAAHSCFWQLRGRRERRVPCSLHQPRAPRSALIGGPDGDHSRRRPGVGRRLLRR